MPGFRESTDYCLPWQDSPRIRQCLKLNHATYSSRVTMALLNIDSGNPLDHKFGL